MFKNNEKKGTIKPSKHNVKYNVVDSNWSYKLTTKCSSYKSKQVNEKKDQWSKIKTRLDSYWLRYNQQLKNKNQDKPLGIEKFIILEQPHKFIQEVHDTLTLYLSYSEVFLRIVCSLKVAQKHKCPKVVIDYL